MGKVVGGATESRNGGQLSRGRGGGRDRERAQSCAARTNFPKTKETIKLEERKTMCIGCEMLNANAAARRGVGWGRSEGGSGDGRARVRDRAQWEENSRGRTVVQDRHEEKEHGHHHVVQDGDLGRKYTH